MSKPHYTSAARDDLRDILLYVAQDKPDAALNLIDKIEAKCLLISNAPELGEAKPEFGDGVRASFVGRYVIFYRPNQKRVEILRVLSGDRNITQL